jgi:perosamine synthetase
MNKGWRFSGNEREYLNSVLESGFGASENGTMNEQLEKKFAQIHNQKFSIAVNSGTSTLHMALNAFGVGNGDEVIIPPLTVVMCGFAVWQCGAIPVYADVEEDSFLIDPDDIEKKITEKTKAIMSVHMYGNMCNMEKIMNIAEKKNLYVLEDSAECFLGQDNKKRISGTIGHVGSWSFESTKHLTSGDGGIVTTNNENLARRMRLFGGLGYKNMTPSSGKVRISRDKFQDPTWERHSMLAYNYRMPELCAAVALAQCEKINDFIDLRIKMGEEYGKILKNSNLFKPQLVYDGYKNTYFTYAARFLGKKYGVEWQEFRKKYMEFGGDGIYAAQQLVFNEPCFKEAKLGWGETPIAEKIQKDVMLFTTNQKNEEERNFQISALQKTLDFFNIK